MICFPGAKINIGLSVLNKRCDGYHNIQSIFYPVKSYSDCIEIIQSDSFQFKKSGIAIPGNDNDNLCNKAYNILKADFNLPNVVIRLIKRIPTGAGLGGGSSDASSTLILLNNLFNLKLDFKDLTEYASILGSDCPFFIYNQPSFISGRGNIIEPFDLNLNGYHLTLINPGFSISTRQAYESFNLNYKKTDLKSAVQKPISIWKDHIINDFESYAFQKYPELSIIRNLLYTDGGLFVSMTGSGSTVYAISANKIDLSSQLKKYNSWQGILP